VHRHYSKRRPSTVIAAEMLRGLVAVSCLMVPCRSSANEENHQCWDCLERLAMDFPEKNPQEDPFLEDGLSVASVIGAFEKCSLNDSEIPTLRRIIGVFSDALFKKDGVAYVRERLNDIPDLSNEDRAKLVDGARQDLSTTLGFLTNRNCRILLQSQFDTGVSRARLLQVVQAGRAMQMAP
jgi:hypothetical protein